MLGHPAYLDDTTKHAHTQRETSFSVSLLLSHTEGRQTHLARKRLIECPYMHTSTQLPTHKDGSHKHTHKNRNRSIVYKDERDPSRLNHHTSQEPQKDVRALGRENHRKTCALGSWRSWYKQATCHVASPGTKTKVDQLTHLAWEKLNAHASPCPHYALLSLYAHLVSLFCPCPRITAHCKYSE